MPVVLRYVDKDGENQERFLQFIHCGTGLSGKALTATIMHLLPQNFKLDIRYCRGKRYDGAGNMAGNFHGLSPRILSINPLALFTHCSYYRLNLCIASSCYSQSVQNMMEHVTKMCYFFNNHPKCQLLLVEMVQNFDPHSKNRTILYLCRTGWILRTDGLCIK